MIIMIVNIIHIIHLLKCISVLTNKQVFLLFSTHCVAFHEKRSVLSERASMSVAGGL